MIRFKTETDQQAYYFRELMAIIHRDGGHYLVEHGTEKAYRDATERYYGMITRLGEFAIERKPQNVPTEN